VVEIEPVTGGAGYRLYGVGEGGHARLLSSHASAAGASLAPDGQHVAYLTQEGSLTLTVENLDGSSKQIIATCREAACGLNTCREAACGGPFFSYAWSPTGDRLIYTTVENGGPHIRIASLTGEVLAELTPERPKPKPNTEPTYYGDATWSPQGHWITVVEAKWDKWDSLEIPLAIDLTRADRSDWRRVLGTSYDRPQFGWPEVAWAPDERFAVEGAADEPGLSVPVYAVFTPNGRQLEVADCARGEPFCPTKLGWSTNGQWIAWMRGFDLIVASPDVKKTRRIRLPAGDRTFARPEWSADSRRIALAQDPGSFVYRDVVVVPARGGSPKRVFSAPRGWEVVSHGWQTVTS
jgi:Tol biopolymer transport system component